MEKKAGYNKANNISKSKKAAFLGIFCALALILSYLESLIPFNFGIPGIKLGLANIVIVFVLYFMSPADAIIVNLVRIVLSGLLFGNLFAILFSICGAAASLAVMWPLSRLRLKSKNRTGADDSPQSARFSPVGTSLAGAVAHNAGQLVAAMFVVGTSKIVYYIPVLLVSGLVTGLVMGIIAELVIRNIGKIKFFN